LVTRTRFSAGAWASREPGSASRFLAPRLPGTQDARRSGYLDTRPPGMGVSTASRCFYLLAGRPDKRAASQPGCQACGFGHCRPGRRPTPPRARQPGLPGAWLPGMEPSRDCRIFRQVARQPDCPASWQPSCPPARLPLGPGLLPHDCPAARQEIRLRASKGSSRSARHRSATERARCTPSP
jgi:hypothetical protein